MLTNEMQTVTIPKTHVEFLDWIDQANPNELFLSLFKTLETSIATWHHPDDEPDLMPTDQVLASWNDCLRMMKEMHVLCICQERNKNNNH